MRHLLLCSMLTLMPTISADSTAPTPPNAPAFAPAVQAVNAFGVDVLNKAVPKGNAIVSPYSIQMALAMTYAGAAGETRKQMAQTLHYGDDAVASFAALSQEMKALPSDLVELKLAIANRLFAQTGYEFLPDYLAAMKRDFAAPVELVDFRAPSADVAKILNDWMAEQTNNRIRDMVAPDAIPANTRLVLANAVYFNSRWQSVFDKKRTIPAPFTLLDGKTREVPMMNKTPEFDYCDMGFYEAEDFVAVKLPYTRKYFRFVAILPKGDFEKFKFTAETLKQLDKMRTEEVILSMPKFRLEPPTLKLSDFLKAAGMPSAFNEPPGSADFSGIAPRRTDEYLYISAVLHKASIDVSEEGTEAAAGIKAFLGGWGKSPGGPRTVKLDRPFYFAIQHNATGACLFLGRLVEP